MTDAERDERVRANERRRIAELLREEPVVRHMTNDEVADWIDQGAPDPREDSIG